MSGPGWKSGRRWRHLTLSARPSTNMVVSLARLLSTMEALKASVIVYAGIDGTHIHILYRGFYLSQPTWSEIWKVCSNGSTVVYVIEVLTREHYEHVVDYIEKQSQTERFINWKSPSIGLEAFM